MTTIRDELKCSKERGSAFGIKAAKKVGYSLTKALEKTLGCICGNAVVAAKIIVILRLVWAWMAIGASLFAFIVGAKLIIEAVGFIPVLLMLLLIGAMVGFGLTVKRETRRRKHRRHHRKPSTSTKPTTKPTTVKQLKGATK